MLFIRPELTDGEAACVHQTVAVLVLPVAIAGFYPHSEEHSISYSVNCYSVNMFKFCIVSVMRFKTCLLLEINNKYG